MPGKSRVLLADDDPVTLRILEKFFVTRGYTPVLCKSGTEALLELRKEVRPHLVLLDWNMPEVSGLEVCKQIRESNEFYYVIMITGRSEMSEINQAFENGVDDFLIKPFDKSVLQSRLLAAERIMKHELKLKTEQRYWQMHAGQMQALAEQRAKQLVHADRMATIGVMSAGVAHEINNPTSFISGNAQTLAKFWQLLTPYVQELSERPSADQQKLQFILKETPELLAGIARGVERISGIVNGLKSYAHSGQQEEFKDYDLKQLLESALKMTASVTKAKADVHLECSGELGEVKADRIQLEQVLINLIVNASDAVEHSGKGLIKVHAQRSGETVILEISDNGPGIPVDALQKIWMPFYTTKEVGKGTGLGLHICKSIIERHGGVIGVSNQDSGGAQFRIELPAKYTEGER